MTEQDVKGVSQAIDKFRAAGRAGDLDAFMANFAEDAVLMLEDRMCNSGDSILNSFLLPGCSID